MLKKVIFFSVSASLALANSIEFDEIVVTATGFEGKLSDEVRNVYVAGEKEISKRGYRTLREALEKIPSVDFSPGAAGEKLDMRGQGDQANTAVKVLINGVPMNMIDLAHGTVPFDMIAIEDVERIEAMPGGGAVLYGGGTRGGVINIITKKTPKEPYANFSTKIGSYKYHDASLNVGGNVSDDLFLKFASKGFTTHGYMDDYKQRGYYLSGALNYQISENSTISFMPSLYKSNSNTIDNLTLAQVMQNRRQNPNSPNTDKAHEKKVDLVWEYNTKLGESWTIDIMPYYLKTEIRTVSTSSEGLFSDEKKGVNAKAKFDYDSGNLIFGYDYMLNDGNRESHMDMKPSPMVRVKNDIVLDLEKQIHALYFYETQNFGDKFSLSFGARHEWAKYDTARDTKTQSGPIVRPSITHNAIKSKKDENNYALEITPNFKYSSTGNIYAKFERGFISPSPSQLTDKLAPNLYSLSNVESETYQTYEIGFKDEFLGNYFSATAFWTDTNDEITYEMRGGMASGSQTWRYYNLAKTRRYGFELYGVQHLFDKIDISESYSYVDSEIKKGVNAGKEVPLISKHKFVVGINYEPIKDLNLFSDIKYYSSKKDSSYNTIAAKTIVDAGFNYKFANGFSVGAGVKNLFNKKYYEYESKSSDLYYPAKERNYYAEFKYDF